jgi:hypothetical protein
MVTNKKNSPLVLKSSPPSTCQPFFSIKKQAQLSQEATLFDLAKKYFDQGSWRFILIFSKVMMIFFK